MATDPIDDILDEYEERFGAVAEEAAQRWAAEAAFAATWSDLAARIAVVFAEAAEKLQARGHGVEVESREGLDGFIELKLAPRLDERPVAEWGGIRYEPEPDTLKVRMTTRYMGGRQMGGGSGIDPGYYDGDRMLRDNIRSTIRGVLFKALTPDDRAS